MTNKKNDEKVKAAPGSSIPAQCKQLVLAIALEIPEQLALLSADLGGDPLALTDVLTPATAEWLTDVNKQITESSQRGLPLATRLANVEVEIGNHWASMTIKDGKAVRSEAWDNEAERLLTKKRNIIRAIKNKDEEAADEAGAEQGEAATV